MTDIPEVRICLDENHPLTGAVAVNFHQGYWQVVYEHDSHNADGNYVKDWAPMIADRSTQPPPQGGAGTLGATVEAQELGEHTDHLTTSDE